MSANKSIFVFAKRLYTQKVDGQKKETLLPVMEAYHQLHSFMEIIPVSALKRDGTGQLLRLIAAHLPEGPPLYETDMLTDRPERFLAEELVREQAEVVWAVGVEVDLGAFGAVAVLLAGDGVGAGGNVGEDLASGPRAGFDVEGCAGDFELHVVEGDITFVTDIAD